jgi:hypothetical protein
VQVASFAADGVWNLVANAKTKLLAVGYRLGPVLAIEHDANRCTALVDTPIREALEEWVAYRVAARRRSSWFI